jgi:hypothetical protein
MESPLLNPEAAGSYLGGNKPIHPDTLAQWRQAGRGPKFLKLGPSRTSVIRYRREDLDAYLESCVRISTSDTGKATEAA